MIYFWKGFTFGKEVFEKELEIEEGKFFRMGVRSFQIRQIACNKWTGSLLSIISFLALDSYEIEQYIKVINIDNDVPLEEHCLVVNVLLHMSKMPVHVSRVYEAPEGVPSWNEGKSYSFGS